MSQRYLGGIITANPTTPTLSSASGVWTLEQQLQYSQSIQPKVIPKSIRTRSSASAYFNRTPASTTNRKTYTISRWGKRGALGSIQYLISAFNASTNECAIRFNANDTLEVEQYTSPSYNYQLVTTQVFRDPSAWFHIVVAVDTTQATASDRIKLYINGVQVTAFSTASYPSQNYDTNFNLASYTNQLGAWNTSYFYDGYSAEINFIDGQALTPSSFGAFDSNGVWQPLTYTGTYGTNGFYLPFNLSTTSAYVGSFSGSGQYLTTPATSALEFGSNNFTIEFFWYATSTTRQALYHGSFGTDWSVGIDYNGDGNQKIGMWASSNGTSWNLINSDAGGNGTGGTISPNINQWNHVAYVRNGTTWTLFVNGQISKQITGLSGTIVNRASSTKAIGCWFSTGAMSQVIGSLSNFRILNGTALYTSPFAVPQTNLTAITNTQLLTLQNATIIDNSTNAFTITNNGSVTMSLSTPFSILSLVSDQSGNGNNWNANNISLTAGATYDSMLDSPTNFDDGGNGWGNYAILNPLSRSTPTGSSFPVSANLTFYNATTASWAEIIASIGVYSGKWYWEITCSNLGPSNNLMLGVVTDSEFSNLNTSNRYVGSTSAGYGYYSYNGNKYNGGSATAYGGAYVTNDVVGVALDMSAGTVTFYKNNVSQGTAFSGLTGTIYPAFSSVGGIGDVNFGQRPFAYTPPTGFKALNTQNLALAAPPTITNGAKYMAATLWSGTGAVQTINNGANNTIGTTFQPDFAWIKGRNNITDHQLVDSVRGTSLYLSSNLTSADATNVTAVTAFNSNGLALGTNSNTSQRVNYSGDTYVGWQWKAGGTSSSNTNGSITSTVSVNATAGFSVVTYTGTSANATVGHGLGVAPSMVIVKNRSAVYDWPVYHAVNGATKYMYLDTTSAAAVASSLWNDTAPTSSVFSIGTSGAVNNSSQNYVAYCFAAVKGYSAFGSYTGNGSSDGPFSYLGFRPRFVMIKRTDSTGNWQIIDTSRSTYNEAVATLYPNLTNAEDTTNTKLDALSNGFKIRGTPSTDFNTSGSTYIYAAFAENPFTISRAR